MGVIRSGSQCEVGRRAAQRRQVPPQIVGLAVVAGEADRVQLSGPSAARLPTTVPAAPGLWRTATTWCAVLPVSMLSLGQRRIDVEILVEEEIAHHGDPHAAEAADQFGQPLRAT